MSDAQGSGLNGSIEEGRRGLRTETTHPRAAGSPLPIGSGTLAALPGGVGEAQRTFAVPPPGRALANSVANASLDAPSGIQRAVSALRAALPFVQRILPLLDGNIGTAVANILIPLHRPPPPPPPVNLAPIQDGLADLQTRHRELRDLVAEQNTSLKRVEDRLEMVHEATDRNRLEQQELLADLKVVGNKVNVFALIALVLLTVSVLVNIFLYLRILKVLP
jgi:hypothetical protein